MITETRTNLAWPLVAVGPLAIAVLRLVMPYDTTDDAATIAAKAAAHPDTQSLVVWLGFVAMLTMAPAVLWVARATHGAAPRLTTTAVALLAPAYLSLGLLVAGDAAAWSGVRVPEHPAIIAGGVVFVVGHVAGTVLLGVAMWFSPAVPRWAAVLTMAAQPLHFVAAVVITSHPLDFVAWGLNAIGFAAAVRWRHER